MANNQGDIHVIYDYQNVIYIDPNKVITIPVKLLIEHVVPRVCNVCQFRNKGNS
jgi:hypothetical protein